MIAPIRIQRKRMKGWRMPANTVYVGRPTKWGNPWDDYESYSNSLLKLPEYMKIIEAGGTVVTSDGGEKYRRLIIAIRAAKRELRGKNLCCWCPLDRPCHADILLKIANQ